MIHKVLGSYWYVKKHEFRVDGGLQQKTLTAEATGRLAFKVMATQSQQ